MSERLTLVKFQTFNIALPSLPPNPNNTPPTPFPPCTKHVVSPPPSWDSGSLPLVEMVVEGWGGDLNENKSWPVDGLWRDVKGSGEADGVEVSTSSVSDMTSGRGEVWELVRDEEEREETWTLFSKSNTLFYLHHTLEFHYRISPRPLSLTSTHSLGTRVQDSHQRKGGRVPSLSLSLFKWENVTTLPRFELVRGLPRLCQSSVKVERKLVLINPK